MIIPGDKIYLKEGLAEENYPYLLKWFQAIDLVSYLYSAEKISKFQTVEEVKEFLKEYPDEIFFGIYSDKDEFIGYTSLSEFQEKETCDFCIFIFEKKYWGRGIGEEVTRLMLEYAFSGLRMKKVTLETSELHKKAIHLYKKCGFSETETISDNRTVFHDGKWMRSGSIGMEITNNS